MTKPIRVSSHDANHYIPRDFLRDRCGGFETHEIRKGVFCYTARYKGFTILLRDTSAYGGVMLDWEIECFEKQRAAHLEVKTPEAFRGKDNGMRPGEKFMFLNSSLFRFVVDDDNMQQTLDWLVAER